MAAKTTYRTMEEFAAACGVSRPTLAKYFADPLNVKETTRNRIEAVLKKSDFEPNLFARHLNSKRVRNVGIIIPTMYDPFFSKFLARIELGLRSRGFWPVQISCHTLPELEEEAVRSMLEFKVQGVIVSPLGATSKPCVFDRLKNAVPMVCFDVPLDDDVPFGRNVFFLQCKPVHPARLHPHDEVEAVGCDALEIGGIVERGEGVVAAAVGGDGLAQLA